MEAVGVTSTWQLLGTHSIILKACADRVFDTGKFLAIRHENMSEMEHVSRDQLNFISAFLNILCCHQMDAFWEWLESCNTPSGNRSGVVLAVASKFRCGLRLPINAINLMCMKKKIQRALFIYELELKF